MTRQYEVPGEEMNYVWVSNHYDFHIEGLCRYNGKLCHFELLYEKHPETWDDDDDDDDEYLVTSTPRLKPGACAARPVKLTYRVTELNFFDRLRWCFNQRAFEICVGTHWSYRDNHRRSRYAWRRPHWLHHLLFHGYYAVQGLLRKMKERRRGK